MILLQLSYNLPVDLNEVVLKRETFGVLASNTRLRILKALKIRRKTITELADDLDLAKSTVHHHLKRLSDSGFVAADDENHAWLYYSLTPQGYALMDPNNRIRIRILLAAALFSFTGGVCILLYNLIIPSLPESPGPSTPGGGGLPSPPTPSFNLLLIGISLLLVGGFLIVYTLIWWRNERSFSDSFDESFDDEKI